MQFYCHYIAWHASLSPDAEQHAYSLLKNTNYRGRETEGLSCQKLETMFSSLQFAVVSPSKTIHNINGSNTTKYPVPIRSVSFHPLFLFMVIPADPAMLHRL